MRSAPLPTDTLGGTPILCLDGVSERHADRLALDGITHDGITLDGADDRPVSLLDASGSGKPVSLRAIAGFETLDAGTVALRAEPSDGRPAHRRDIGSVFQTFALGPHPTVQQNSAGERPPARGVAERVRAMVDLVGLSGLQARAVTAVCAVLMTASVRRARQTALQQEARA